MWPSIILMAMCPKTGHFFGHFFSKKSKKGHGIKPESLMNKWKEENQKKIKKIWNYQGNILATFGKTWIAMEEINGMLSVYR